MRKVSVIIATYNRYLPLRRLLLSLVRSEPRPYEIVVVDDGSTDRRVERIPDEFPSVRLVENPGPRGPHFAREYGIQKARGDLIAILDDDGIVRRDWLKYVLPHFDDRRVGVVGCRVVYLGCCRERVFALKAHWFEGDSVRWERYSRERPIEVPFVSEHGMVFRRELVRRTPYLDRGLIGDAWGESISFCMRVRRLGYKVIFEPRAVVYHARWPSGGTNRFGKHEPRGLYYRCSNKVYIFLRYHGRKWQLPLFLAYLILDGLRHALKYRDPRATTSTLAGIIRGFRQYIGVKASRVTG